MDIENSITDQAALIRFRASPPSILHRLETNPKPCRRQVRWQQRRRIIALCGVKPRSTDLLYDPIRVNIMDNANVMETPASIIQTGCMEVRRLYLAPGHNFFGRHGQPPAENPIVEVAELECVAGRGLRGDRFFDYRENYKGQITFFAWETYEAICLALGVRDKMPSAFRRNVITAGADLNELIGREFWVQGVQFRGMEECRPCYWMDQAFAPGANEFLKGQGGLRAAILNNGILRANPP